MIGEIDKDNKGNPKNPSLYQPSDEVKKLMIAVKDDYAIGYDILHKPFTELNDMSVIQRMNVDQKSFNSYVPPHSEDPDESWHANTVRPTTRNKIISIAAHVTSSVLYPNIFAQNDRDEEDRLGADVMKDVVKWVMNKSDYEFNFVFGVISALVNPAVILKADFVEAMQTVKERSENGEITEKEVRDEILSGFWMNIVPVDELLITNAYEFDIQRQRAILRRRFIDYEEAEAIHGDHEDFQFVQRGIRALYNADDATFYDQFDDDLGTLVEEVTYYHRTKDMELTFVNGILVSDPDQPMRHRDTKNRPKYPYAKGGYEPIDEKRFFYMKSAAYKLGPDQELTDIMWNMVLDGTFMSIMPPVATFGGEDISSAVMVPGSVTNFSDPNNTIQSVNPSANLNAGFNALSSLEQSMSESSQDKLQQGIPTGGGRTAFEISRIEQNARVQLGLFGKMISKLVTDFGLLMVEDIVNHITVGQVEELTAGESRLNFRQFLLPEEEIEGQKTTKKIQFVDDLEPKDEKSRLERSFKIMEEEGGLDSDVRIRKVNPAKFHNLSFMLTVEPDKLIPRSESIEKAMNLEAYDRMIQNPLVDQAKVTQDFLVESFAKGQSARYMSDQPNMPIEGGRGGGETAKILQQLTGNQSNAQQAV